MHWVEEIFSHTHSPNNLYFLFFSNFSFYYYKYYTHSPYIIGLLNLLLSNSSSKRSHPRPLLSLRIQHWSEGSPTWQKSLEHCCHCAEMIITHYHPNTNTEISMSVKNFHHRNQNTSTEIPAVMVITEIQKQIQKSLL